MFTESQEFEITVKILRARGGCLGAREPMKDVATAISLG